MSQFLQGICQGHGIALLKSPSGLGLIVPILPDLTRTQRQDESGMNKKMIRGKEEKLT